jgi:hypothetical protein
MTPPAGVPNTLDLAVDPQLVHDLAETFNAGVGDKRAKTCGSYRRSGSIWSRMKLAYSLNGCMATSRFSTNMPARVEPALSLV